MKIEDEIQQKKFKSAYQKAHINVLYTSNHLINQTKSILKPFGITHQQFNVLKILKGRHPEACNAQDIKAVMLDKGPDITRLIDRLIKKDLVVRIVCPENRRKINLSITMQGIELIKTIDPKLNRQLFKQNNITEKEAEELSRILDKMRN